MQESVIGHFAIRIMEWIFSNSCSSRFHIASPLLRAQYGGITIQKWHSINVVFAPLIHSSLNLSPIPKTAFFRNDCELGEKFSDSLQADLFISVSKKNHQETSNIDFDKNWKAQAIFTDTSVQQNVEGILHFHQLHIRSTRRLDQSGFFLLIRKPSCHLFPLFQE